MRLVLLWMTDTSARNNDIGSTMRQTDKPNGMRLNEHHDLSPRERLRVYKGQFPSSLPFAEIASKKALRYGLRERRDWCYCYIRGRAKL